MRSRTLREGSVGLFILMGLAVLAGVAFWLREIQLGTRPYNLRVEFANANGLSVGTPVRYRGVDVGKLVALEPGVNGVEAILEI
ncbi:MAG: MlaD family protein, partial [Cyanobacteriota bacterium]|nr:MlaD family protein [Cyanobacteriota bacterium]